MKIAFLLPTMSAGGAERVAAILCHEWARLGHEVHLLTYIAEKDGPAYELASEIRWHRLEVEPKSGVGFLRRNIWRLFAIRRQLRAVAPDIMVCFLTEANVTGILASVGLRFPVVISERVHPGFHFAGKAHEILRRLTYPRAARLVVQTSSIASWCRENLSVEASVIPNPVRLGPRLGNPGTEVTRRPVIVAMGRLEHQKGFDLLIEAFTPIAAQYPDWSIEIFGEGTMRQSLEDQIQRSGMVGRITLMGLVKDTDDRLRSAEVYCHPSRYEGFPNALLEALACGCCVVAAGSPGATAEILAGGTYGLLAAPNDVSDLRRQLVAAISSADVRRRFMAAAPQAVRGFDASSVAGRWIQVFEEQLA